MLKRVSTEFLSCCLKGKLFARCKTLSPLCRYPVPAFFCMEYGYSYPVYKQNVNLEKLWITLGIILHQDEALYRPL